MPTYAAMLRAINVTGRNKITMAALRDAFVELGYEGVATYIQSGNVVFETSARRAGLAPTIEDRIAREFGQSITVVLRTAKELESIVAHNPFLRRRNVDRAQLHVTFLASTPSRSAIAALTLPPGPDELIVEGKDVYVSTPGGYGRTKLNNTFVERGLGVATTRNWNTVTKLCELTAAR